MVYTSSISNKTVETYYDCDGVERVLSVGFSQGNKINWYDADADADCDCEFYDVDITNFGDDLEWYY